MIGRFFRLPGLHVNVAINGFLGQRCRRQDMINQPAQPSFHRFGNAVIEKSVLFRFHGVMLTKYVSQSPRLDSGKGLTDIRREADMPEQPFRIMHIDVFRGDVKVAQPDQGHIR